MTPEEVIDHYKSRPLTAEALGVSVQAVRQWIENGYIPFNTQFRIQVLTGMLAEREDQRPGTPGPKRASAA